MMSAAAQSLLLEDGPRDAQLMLFAGIDLPKIDRSEPPGTYTGERLFRDRPAIYRTAVELLAEPGISCRQICRSLHLSEDTLRAVAARESIPIGAAKALILKSITHGLRLATERLVETLPTADAKTAAIATGILTEKMQLLSGEATARIETGSRGDVFAGIASLHADLVQMAQAREIGFDAGKSEQKRLPNPPESTPPAADLITSDNKGSINCEDKPK